MNPLHRYAVRCPAFRFYVDFLMNYRNHQPLHNILVLVGNINPVWVYPIAAGFIPAAVLVLAVVNAILVHDHIGAWHDRAFAVVLRRGCLRNICRKCGRNALAVYRTYVDRYSISDFANQYNLLFYKSHNKRKQRLSKPLYNNRRE